MKNNFTLISEVVLSDSVDSIVGMAVYQQDKLTWIHQAATSIIDQTYKNFVFLIVIDGDISDEILTHLVELSKKTPNVLLVRGNSNRGLSTCMNFVVDWALQYIPKAKYFFRMDADDISEPNRLQSQIDFFDQHPQITVLGTSLLEVNEKGKKVGQRQLPKEHGEIVRMLPRRCTMNHPTVAIRLTVFQLGFRYREHLKNTQDYFFWSDLAAAGFRFANLSEKLLKFRRVNDFYKRRGLGKSMNEFRARFHAMKALNKYSTGNVLHAFLVLGLRVMPPQVVKLAYKLDRYLQRKLVDKK